MARRKNKNKVAQIPGYWPDGSKSTRTRTSPTSNPNEKTIASRDLPSQSPSISLKAHQPDPTEETLAEKENATSSNLDPAASNASLEPLATDTRHRLVPT